MDDAERIRLRPWTSGNCRDNIIWCKYQGEHANCIPNKRLTSTVYMELLQLLLCSWNSPGKNTRLGSYPKGIFLIQGSNSGLLHYTHFLYILSHQKKPCIPPPIGSEWKEQVRHINNFKDFGIYWKDLSRIVNSSAFWTSEPNPVKLHCLELREGNRGAGFRDVGEEWLYSV